MEVEFELDTLLAVESDDDPENITVLARGILGTSITINIFANITAGGAGTWSVLHIILPSTYIHTIVDSCKLCCKCTVLCSI